MSAIAREWASVQEHVADALHHHHPSSPSQPEEQPMTTPQQPQRNIFADVASVLTEVAGNPLMVRLARERLGELLKPDDIEHVVSIVRRIEDGEHAVAVAEALHQQRTAADNGGQPVPQFTPHDDSAQFPADGQHG